MRIWARHLLFALALTAAMAVTGWLLTGTTSPAHNYFLNHVEAPNLWRVINLPAFLVAAMVDGNAHQPSGFSFAAIFIAQWAALGILFSWIFLQLRTRLRQ
jgi:hypothetical protein